MNKHPIFMKKIYMIAQDKGILLKKSLYNLDDSLSYNKFLKFIDKFSKK